jgi:uncharacterized protein (DUF1778 family)
LADRTMFTVAPENWEAFVDALDRPAEVRPELVRLFTRPRPS